MILLDIFSSFIKEDKEPSFFLFANSAHKRDYLEDLLLSNNDFTSNNSICIFFNMGLPLQYYPILAKHKHKWIFFRLLALHEQYGTFFRDLSLLQTHSFDKFFFIPDILDPQYRSKNFLIPTIDHLISNNIDISNLSHFSLFDQDEISNVKKYYPKNSKKAGTMSSGFWVYLYLKGIYKNASFNIVNYSFKSDEKYHNPLFERAYFLAEIFSKRCNAIDCILDTTH